LHSEFELPYPHGKWCGFVELFIAEGEKERGAVFGTLAAIMYPSSIRVIAYNTSPRLATIRAEVNVREWNMLLSFSSFITPLAHANEVVLDEE